MAAKGLVKIFLRSCDLKLVEQNIVAFIESRNDNSVIDRDYLESLDVTISHILEIYAKRSDGNKYQDQTGPNKSFALVPDKILTDICLPFLRDLQPLTDGDDKRKRAEVLQLTYKLISKITCGGPHEVSERIWLLIINSLKNFVDECRHGFGEGHEIDSSHQVLGVTTTLDLLGCLLETMQNWKDENLKFGHHEILPEDLNRCVFEAVLSILKVARSESLIFKITGRILLRLLSMNESNVYQDSKAIWDSVKDILLQEGNEDKDYSGFFASYAIMSSLADFYFTLSAKPVFQVHRVPKFWTMLQKGLVNIDPLIRKRCLYLLQKAVDMFKDIGDQVVVKESRPVVGWNPENANDLLKVWHQYVFLFETLEEKQLHVIKPVLPRLADLVDATKKTIDSKFPLLHVSWLTVLIHRAVLHENRFIKKWAITSLLTLDLERVPVLKDPQTRLFVSDTLIVLLKEPTLYAKNDGECKREPSKLSNELISFFEKCFNSLANDHKTEFISQILSSIHEYNISHVPLTYLCQGLVNVPCFPVFGGELLIKLRSILSNMTSHSVVLRGAVQTFLLRTFMNFIDPRSIHLDEVFMFLGCFVREESLCRGVSIWTEVGQWLCMHANLCHRETKDLFLFLDKKLRTFIRDSHLPRDCAHALRLAKFILLCYDCSIISSSQVNQLFDVVFSAISKAHSSPYYPVTNCWRAVELLRALFHESHSAIPSEVDTDSIVVTLVTRLHDVLLGLMQCLKRTVGEDDECATFQGYRTCFEFLDEVKWFWLLEKFTDNLCQKYQFLTNKLAEIGLGFLHDSTTKDRLRFTVAVKWLAWVKEFARISGMRLASEHESGFLECVRSWNLLNNLRYQKSSCPSSNVELLQSTSTFKQSNWRVVAEDIISAQWQCVNMAENDQPCASVKSIDSSNVCSLAGSSIDEIVDACIEALSLVSGPASLPCLETLQLLLPKLVAACDERTSTRLLGTVWIVLNEIRSRYSAYFWPALDAVVKTIFSPELLILPTDHPLALLVARYWASLLEMAHDQSGLIRVAVSHLCKVFSGVYKPLPVDVLSQALLSHVGIIADICLFGPVHKKDLRLLSDTVAYIKSVCHDCGAVCLTKQKEVECESECVRADIVTFLLTLDINGHQFTAFFVALINALLGRNQVLSEVKASRFLNSENHRQKQRLWQVIFILICRVDDEVFAMEVARKVLQALQSDNQTSVRFLMEWVLVRVFSTYMQHLDVMWRLLKNVSKMRLGYVASLVTVATHILLTLEEANARRNYLSTLLPVIIPCAFLNHSQIRAYILDALRLISVVCSGSVWSHVIEQFPIVDSCLTFANNVVEGEKEKGRLQKDRALFALHPVEDFSIEVVFETVPAIAGVVEEEIISPAVFQAEGSLSWDDVKGIPLYRRGRPVQRKSSSSKEKVCLFSESANEGHDSKKNADVKTKNHGEGLQSVASDVQKKITPWQVTAPPQEDVDLLYQVHQRPIQRRVGDLIVVASLIDRAPNLGGLCRTCEIFGASKLVLGSKHVVSESGFQSLSVSSQKWVEIEEIKVNELAKYLGNMKKVGFTVVGVEQTAQSTKLTDFQFPYNTVLVLGNEKGGIPVELIQLLDECVEIPQHGIIRSLNVHVSGALFIWEYSRQHMNS